MVGSEARNISSLDSIVLTSKMIANQGEARRDISSFGHRLLSKLPYKKVTLTRYIVLLRTSKFLDHALNHTKI